MSDQKFSGILNEIISRYPNIDIVDFLEVEMGVPRFKAEALADRIEKQFLQKAPIKAESKIQRLFEEKEEAEVASKESVYSVDCLSEKEFEHFICWMFEELGYELQLEKHRTGFGFVLLATRGNEKVAIQAIRCPKNCNVANSIVLMSEELKRKHGCEKSIVVATGFFAQQAIEDAQRSSVELWDIDCLSEKITEVRGKSDLEVQARFPQYQGTLLQSLLKLVETKEFLIESKAEGKYDLLLPGVKYPLLTFQAHANTVTRCVFRIKYNEPVSESEGEAVISSDDDGNRLGPDDIQAYALIIQYLEQFLE